MRLESVTIYNFKNYKGKNIIGFINKENTKNKNIILIGGLNGAGKTTLLEAIKLCLYGKNFNGNNISKNEYNKFIHSILNRKAAKENNKRCFIEVKIMFDDSYPAYTLEVRRSWVVANQEKIEEDFEISRDNNPLEFISKEYWQEYINYLIPPHVSEFFFFNGEKVKELAVGTNADEILKSSIKDLIGLNLYESLINDLSGLKSKIRRRNEQKGEINKKFIEYELHKKQKLKDIQKLKIDINKSKKKIKDNENKIDALDQELKRKAGAFAQQKQNAEGQILTLQETNATLNEQIATIAKDYLPFTIPKKLRFQLLRQLENEQTHKNTKFVEEIWKERITDFSTKLTKESKVVKTLPKKDKKIIQEEIKSILKELFDINEESKTTLLHDLTISEFEYIKNFLRQSSQKITKEFETVLHERQKNSLKMDKIKKQLKHIPNDTFVISNLQEIQTLKSENETLNKNITELQEKLSSFDSEIQTIQKTIEECEEDIVCIDEDNQKIGIIERINNAINDYVKEMVTSNTKNLEHTISTMYHDLANKDDMIKEIKVDPYTFATELFDYDGNLIKKEGISEGEKEIYAISVLWGLSKLSPHKLPMIIDTPLAKLDTKHVANITTKFFPNASDQVILLSQDREIDQNIYNLIKPNINQSYTLLQTDENKIKLGYFFK